MPNRPSPHITVPTSKRLYPHWRQKFPRLHLKFRFATGAGDRSQGGAALIYAAIELLEVGQIGGEHPFNDAGIDAVQITQAGDHPGQYEYAQIRIVGLDPGIPQRRYLVHGRGQTHHAFPV